MISELLLSVALLSAPVPVYAQEYNFNEELVLENALTLIGIDKVYQLYDFDYNSYDFEQELIGLDMEFKPGQVFLIGDLANPGYTDEHSCYMLDIYYINVSNNILYFTDSDTELYLDYGPWYLVSRNDGYMSVLVDTFNITKVEKTVSDIVASYPTIWNNRVIINYHTWYQLGYNDGFIDGVNDGDIDLSWLNFFNNFFTFEFIPGLKFYYILLIGLGIAILGAVIKVVK